MINPEVNPEDSHWQNLVALSAPAFAGADDAPPYGFTTRVLARLKTENRQRELMERIGMRALFASLVILLLTGAVTLGVSHGDRGDFEPGLRGIIQAANVPIS
jgi:hypothetical protein